MNFGFPSFPEAASEYAKQVDWLYAYLNIVTTFFTVGIIIAIIIFSIVFARKSEEDRPKGIHGSVPLEIFWSVIPFLLCLVMFVWGTDLHFQNSKAPADSMEFLVTGKQWMWKVQHPNGKREINDLHVPAGTPVKLTMTSEDVIHSYYIPSMRIKRDTVPGRYTEIWFEAIEPGTHHILCTEFCGTEHSRMIGTLTVMAPADYQEWAGSGAMGDITVASKDDSGPMLSVVEQGKAVFTETGCAVCHIGGGPAQLGPSLEGVFGTEEELIDGTKVLVDEDYIRESILNPAAKIVKGYQPVMPPYVGQIPEEKMMQLIAYIKSLAEESTANEGEI